MAKPSQKDVEAALAKGEPVPAGEYAIDFAGGMTIRDLTAEEKAAVKADTEQATAAAKTTPSATSPSSEN